MWKCRSVETFHLWAILSLTQPLFTSYIDYLYLLLRVNGLIKHPQENLPKVEHPCVGNPALDQFLQKVIRNRFPGFVMFGHPPEWLFLPAPVLQHLRRGLHEIPLHAGPTDKVKFHM